MRKTSPALIAAMLLLAGSQTPAFAQAKSKAPAAKAPAASATPSAPATAGPTKEQIEDAAFEVSVFSSAMQSDKIEAPVKNALFECAYNNSFAKISEAIAKVIAQNPDKVAKRNPDQIVGIMAGICGYRPQPAAATPGQPAPARPAPSGPAEPPKPGTQPQGR